MTTMTPDQTATATRILCESLGVEPNEIVDSAKLADDLGADSLDPIEMRMGFEETFNIEITDDEVDALVTVGDVFALLGRKLG